MDALKKEARSLSDKLWNRSGHITHNELDETLDTLIDKVALRVIEMCEKKVLKSRTTEEALAVSLSKRGEEARRQACADLKTLKETISSKD